jgi:hypothetical protein
MSFLAAEPTEMATLEETLAFIDSLDWEGSNAISSASSPSPSSLSSSSDDKCESPVQSSDDSCGSPLQAISINKLSLEDTTTGQQPQKRGKAKRKRCTLSSSTRLQQSKKAELLFLRRRVQELEQYVQELKAPKRQARSLLPGLGSSGKLSTSQSMEFVNSAYRARRESEETNRTLKSILARHVQAINSLRNVLLNGVRLEVRFLMRLVALPCDRPTNTCVLQPPVLRRDFVSIGNENAIMGMLERKTAQLYLDSDSVFTSEKSLSLRHSTQVSVDSNRNKVSEIATVTPVPCPMDTVNKLMEKGLHNNRQYPDKWYQTVSGACSGCSRCSALSHSLRGTGPCEPAGRNDQKVRHSRTERRDGNESERLAIHAHVRRDQPHCHDWSRRDGHNLDSSAVLHPLVDNDRAIRE